MTGDELQTIEQWQPTLRLRWAEDINGGRVLQQEWTSLLKDSAGKFTRCNEWRAVPVEYDY